jgi:hypothetical protein
MNGDDIFPNMPHSQLRHNVATITNYTEIPDEQPKRTKKEKMLFSQTSRLENPEELQLNNNHQNFLLLTVLLLPAQCKKQCW